MALQKLLVGFKFPVLYNNYTSILKLFIIFSFIYLIPTIACNEGICQLSFLVWTSNTWKYFREKRINLMSRQMSFVVKCVNCIVKIDKYSTFFAAFTVTQNYENLIYLVEQNLILENAMKKNISWVFRLTDVRDI